MTPRIALDIDGCFANWYGALRSFAARHATTPEDFRQCALLPSRPEDAIGWRPDGIEPEWFSGMLWRTHKTPGWWRDQIPVLDCIYGNRLTVHSLLRQLHDMAEVLFVTSRYSLVDNASVASSEWFNLHGLYPRAQVISCPSVKEKMDFLRYWKPSFLLEDDPRILNTRLPCLKVFAPRYPYNDGAPVFYCHTPVQALESIVLNMRNITDNRHDPTAKAR